MKAGRELDAKIASLVMGHVLKTSELGTVYEENPIPGTKDGIQTMELAYYSVSMHSAWKVVEKLAVLRRTREEPGGMIYKPVIRLEFYEHDDEYWATLGRCKGIMGDSTDISAGGPIGEHEVPREPRESYMERAMCWTICQLALRVMG